MANVGGSIWEMGDFESDAESIIRSYIASTPLYPYCMSEEIWQATTVYDSLRNDDANTGPK